MKIFEAEVQRRNVTPKQFFSYCKKVCERKRININDWTDFETWCEPIKECSVSNKHEDWETPQEEMCVIKPFEIHLYLQGEYNFIMEFDFFNDKVGNGYMYLSEKREG